MELERPTINKDIVYWENQYLNNKMIQTATDLKSYTLSRLIEVTVRAKRRYEFICRIIFYNRKTWYDKDRVGIRLKNLTN